METPTTEHKLKPAEFDEYSSHAGKLANPYLKSANRADVLKSKQDDDGLLRL